MKTKIYEVKTIEEAKSLAVSEFGVSESEIEFTIKNEKKGFLGIGGKLEVEAVILVDGAAKGKEYLQKILDANNIKAVIEKKIRQNLVEYNVDAGEMNGFLIGKNSRNLMAMQTLLTIVVNNYYDQEEQMTVLVDVGGYKKRREKTLEHMAVQFGKQVAKTKQRIKLDYLNAYERKIVHNKLSSWKDVNTFSEGEEPKRFLVIEPKDANKK